MPIVPVRFAGECRSASVVYAGMLIVPVWCAAQCQLVVFDVRGSFVSWHSRVRENRRRAALLSCRASELKTRASLHGATLGGVGDEMGSAQCSMHADEATSRAKKSRGSPSPPPFPLCY